MVLPDYLLAGFGERWVVLLEVDEHALEGFELGEVVLEGRRGEGRSVGLGGVGGESR